MSAVKASGTFVMGIGMARTLPKQRGELRLNIPALETNLDMVLHHVKLIQPIDTF